MSFLKAEWRKLAMVNYEIDPSLLAPYLPHGTELDLWNGKCYLSLVGFLFKNTKLMGVKVPFHSDFEEVNLRFYVKRIVGGETRRGVVFIKEIVSKPALTVVANTVYNENYQTMPMRYSWDSDKNSRTVEYCWKKGNEWNGFRVVADLEPEEMDIGSEEEFITEHYWGYAKYSSKKTNEYEVTHPRWQHYPVRHYDIFTDYGATYGSEFKFLNDLIPASVLLSEGSEITVEHKKTIT